MRLYLELEITTSIIMLEAEGTSGFYNVSGYSGDVYSVLINPQIKPMSSILKLAEEQPKALQEI